MHLAACLVAIDRVSRGRIQGVDVGVVYLMPDLSRAGMAQWVGTDIESAAIRRLFYVGMTRARDSLVLCNPAGRMAVQI